jgi:hypothetical protein
VREAGVPLADLVGEGTTTEAPSFEAGSGIHFDGDDRGLTHIVDVNRNLRSAEKACSQGLILVTVWIPTEYFLRLYYCPSKQYLQREVTCP